MTRKGCSCTDCVPGQREVSAAEFARCPKGHATVMLTNGKNLRGPYVSARCFTPGCGSKETIYVDVLPPTESIADRAARYAHDHHVTRAKAARHFGTTLAAVVASWELLYPNEPRIRT